MASVSFAAWCFMCVVAGSLSDHGVPLRWLIASCFTVGGVSWLLFALSSSYWMMLALITLACACMCTISPTNAAVPGLVPPGSVGTWIAAVDVCEVVGGVVAIAAFSVGSTETIYGIEGWRVLWACVGCFSFAAGAAIALGLRLPSRPWRLGELSILREILGMIELCRIRTVGLCVTAMALWHFPIITWMVISPLYLQYTGMSNYYVALVCAGVLCARVIFSVPAGYIGDVAARRSPFHGRQIVAEISLLAWCVLVVASLLPSQSSLTLTAAVAHGLAMPVIRFALIFPMVESFVDNERKGSFMGLMFLVILPSSIGPPICAFLAENVFGYQVRTKERIRAGPGRDIDELPEERRAANESALASSLLWCLLVPLAVCLVITVLLHRTYSADVVSRGKGRPECQA
jgi:MFS family permease